MPCSSQITCTRRRGGGQSKSGGAGKKGPIRDGNLILPSFVRSWGTHLPELSTDLVAALTTLDVNDLTARGEGRFFASALGRDEVAVGERQIRHSNSNGSKKRALIPGTTPHDVRDARISANAMVAAEGTDHSPHGS